MLMLRLVAFCACIALATPASAQITFTNAFPGVTFNTPVEMAMAPGQPDRVYVVEQGQSSGRARIMTLETGDAAATVFLDIDGLVSTAGQEMGFLGLAFHPDYETNGRLFVHYTADGPRRNVIAEYTRDATNPLIADPNSARVILQVNQPFANHNGGKIAFGPDGYLYISIGDGGSGGDPLETGQDPSDLLGNLLRLDVDPVSPKEPYFIPPDNPFVGSTTAREEVYAYGLRNPWKFSFDSATGDLWLADVGQNQWEEVDLIVSGGNYGWDDVEGPVCFEGPCDLSAYEAPILTYPHSFTTSGGLSITGGFVYHGTEVAGLDGRYLYADFALPRLWMLTYDPVSGSATSQLLTTSIQSIASINEGPGGEAYVVSYSGTIYILGGVIVADEAGPEGGFGIEITGPNPVRGETSLALHVPSGEPARVMLFDALGREVAVLHDGPAAADTRLVLDASTLAPGLYLVHLGTPTQQAVRRLIVTR